MTENEREKKRFRQTKTWKEFRDSIRKKIKFDFLTGKPLHGKWELHHCDLRPENYQILNNEENFIPLNSRSHSTIHFLYSYYIKDPLVLERLKTILDRMKDINS